MSAPPPPPQAAPAVPVEKAFRPYWWGWLGPGITLLLIVFDSLMQMLNAGPGTASPANPVSMACCPIFITLTSGYIFGKYVSRRAGSIAMNVAQLPVWFIFCANVLAVLSRR